MLMTIFTALVLTTTATAAEPDPTKNLPPVVKFQSLSLSGSLTFEVTNPNATPLAYHGYTANAFTPPLKDGTISPHYKLDVNSGGVWKAEGIGWCVFGIGPVSIPAKGKVTFAAAKPAGDWDEMKVGLTWYNSADRKGSVTAWSEPVSRKDVTPKNQP